MHKLVRFLKPYWWMLLLNVALLFAQANADLALPDYLSRIVNVGIQQGGIEHAAPEALRAETLRRVQLWMTPDERAYISERYIPLDETALNYSELTARYPGAAETPVMVVNAQGRADQTELDAIMGKGMLANYFVQQLTADPERTAEMAERAGIKVPALPPGTDLYTVFERLPAEQADAMRAGLTKQFSAMDNKAIVQAAAPALRAEYAALGANVDGMQMSYIIRAGALMLALTAAIMMAMLAVGFLSSMTSSGMPGLIRRSASCKRRSKTI